MSLSELIRKRLLLSMLIVLTIGCVSHYFIFRLFIHHSTDRILYEHRDRFVNYVQQNDTVITSIPMMVHPPCVQKIRESDIGLYPEEVFKDTLLYSELTGDFVPYRQLYFLLPHKEDNYWVRINQPTIESDDLLSAIISSVLLLCFLFVVFAYFLESSMNNTMWKPLYVNLQRLRAYDLRANTVLELSNPGIQEFDELNNVIMRMVRKINEDYDNSRIFTEDASHEMQTPLAVIKSKLDLLIQDESIRSPEHIKNIKAMQRAVTRLSRLNRLLLLITQINNDQYQDKEVVDFKQLIEGYLSDFEEFIDARGITVRCELESKVCIMNAALAEMLVANLLSNAIRHNIESGSINIMLKEGRLVVINDCPEIGKVDASKNLFDRLVNHNHSVDSIGLGLNIVKSICEKNGFIPHYSYLQNCIFRIEIAFKS